jgi:hypothetical protein
VGASSPRRSSGPTGHLHHAARWAGKCACVRACTMCGRCLRRAAEDWSFDERRRLHLHHTSGCKLSNARRPPPNLAALQAELPHLAFLLTAYPCMTVLSVIGFFAFSPFAVWRFSTKTCQRMARLRQPVRFSSLLTECFFCVFACDPCRRVTAGGTLVPAIFT